MDLEIQLQQVTQALENALNDGKKKGEQKREATTKNNAGLSMLRAGTVTVGKKLGEGSFGAVYRATWRGAQCALKFVPQETVDELRKEVSIMERIDHPNIVRLYGVVVKTPGEKLPESWPESEICCTRNSR
jgi:serine/threonine protein kinase